jgi:CRISPR system Cascade subunit CasE
MYQSILVLNLDHPDAKRDLKDCQEMHRTLSRAFPGQSEGLHRQEHGLLWRAEPSRGLVVVQSASVPDWQWAEENGYLDGFAQVKWCLTESEEGDVYRFTARLNAVKRDYIPEGKRQVKSQRGALRAVRGRKALTEWFAAKGRDAGFVLAADGSEMPRLKVAEEELVRGTRQGKPLVFHSVSFCGDLIVTDAEKFDRMLNDGLGREKSYGFGLVTVGQATQDSGLVPWEPAVLGRAA